MNEDFFDAVEKAYNKGITSKQQFVDAKEYITKINEKVEDKVRCNKSEKSKIIEDADRDY